MSRHTPADARREFARQQLQNLLNVFAAAGAPVELSISVADAFLESIGQQTVTELGVRAPTFFEAVTGGFLPAGIRLVGEDKDMPPVKRREPEQFPIAEREPVAPRVPVQDALPMPTPRPAPAFVPSVALGPVINLPPGVEFEDVGVIAQRFPVGQTFGFITSAGRVLLPEL